MVEEFNAVGIPAIVILPSSESFDAIKNAQTLLGQVVDKNERAKELVDLFDSTIAKAQSIASKSDKTVMFLGDLGWDAGAKLLSMHGEKLKSDIVQMAHHGQNGVERDVYEAIAPSACIWCTPLWLWNNDAGKGYNTHVFKTIIVRGWMDELGVKEHYVAKDGDQTILL